MTTFTRSWIIPVSIALLAMLATMSAQAATVVADATASTNLSGIMPWTTNFDGSRSQCVGSYPCQYHWNYGDGTESQSFDDATGIKTSSHVYTTAGNFTAT